MPAALRPVLLLAAAAALCLPAAASAQMLPGGEMTDLSSTRRTYLSEVLGNVERTVTAWKAAREAGNLDAALRLYTPDASFFPFRGEPSTGGNRLRETLGAQLAAEDDFRATMNDFTAGGGLAYYAGEFTYQVRREGGGEPITAAGTYILVLERGSGGWRIRSHVERADMALLEAQEAAANAAAAAAPTSAPAGASAPASPNPPPAPAPIPGGPPAPVPTPSPAPRP